MAKQQASAAGKPVKKVKKNITTADVHVNATFNNTHVTGTSGNCAAFWAR